MSAAELRNHQQSKTEFVPISADERDRERDLRARFADFWETASGEPRAIYDAFISASPSTPDVVLEPVDESSVRGWWVRPPQAGPGQAILFLHGGGYVVGSAKAYREFVSQIVSRTRIPALVIDYPLQISKAAGSRSTGPPNSCATLSTADDLALRRPSISKERKRLGQRD